MPDYQLDPSVCCIKGCDREAAALGLCINHWRRNRQYGSPVARKSHAGMFRGLSVDERFDLQVVRRDGCWGWRGSKDQDGYPSFRATFDGVTYNRAHRYSYVRHTGEHPGSSQVLHSCDNPTCCNPDHLFLGTCADNMADKVAKGRTRVVRGEASGRSKLSEQQARDILLDPRPYQVIAEDYSITPATVGDIKNRKSWAFVNVEPVKGSHRGNARRGVSDKLTEQDIRDIRASQDTGKAMAGRYGVSAQSICDIRKRRSWKHVT